MMPVMPMDPVGRAAAVAQAMMETAASQSMEPGPLGDVGMASSAAPDGAAGVMPVPPSTATAAGAGANMAPSAAQVVPGAPGAIGTTAAASASASARGDTPEAVASGGESDAARASDRSRPSESSVDTAVQTVQPSLFANTIEGAQRRRVEREEHPGRRRPRADPPAPDSEDEPHRDEPSEWDDAGGDAAPRRPLSLATLTPFLSRHAGGLAWTELQQGRRVIVLDIGDAHEGRLRGALLTRDAHGGKAAMPFRAGTEAGWGLAWRQLARQHWRLHRDLTPGGKHVLTSAADQAIRPFRICLQASKPTDGIEPPSNHMTIDLADPMRFQRHLGRQWTYLVLLHSLDHEPDPAP